LPEPLHRLVEFLRGFDTLTKLVGSTCNHTLRHHLLLLLLKGRLVHALVVGIIHRMIHLLLVHSSDGTVLILLLAWVFESVCQVLSYCAHEDIFFKLLFFGKFSFIVIFVRAFRIISFQNSYRLLLLLFSWSSLFLLPSKS